MFLKLLVVFINAVVVHDFGVSGPVGELVCGACEGVELVPQASE